MLQCMQTFCQRTCQGCRSCCADLRSERHMRSYRRSIKDKRGLLHNKFFIFGQDPKKISFLNFYDHATKKLIDLPIKEDLRNYSGSAMIDSNRLFICGGVNFEMNSVVSHAKIYNISQEKFTTLASMSMIRFNFPVLHYQNRIYVTGGRGYGTNEVAIMNDCEYFDLDKLKWVQMSPMNVKRCAHQIFVYKKKIYVVGGLSLDKRARVFEEYNPFTDTWRITTRSLVFDLYNFEVFSHDLDEILIVGGMHSKGYSNFIHSFNMRDSRIQCKGFLLNHRSSFKMFYERTKQNLILIGGAVPTGAQANQNYIEIFNLINQRSTPCKVDSTGVLNYITKYNYNRPSVIVQASVKPRKSISTKSPR